MPFERGEILFSKGFFDFTDIRKLQDKAKTSSDNPGSMFYAGCATSFSREGGTGLPQNNPALAEQVETIDKKYLPERRGAVSDDVVMTKLTKALQIQIGAVERYN